LPITPAVTGTVPNVRARRREWLAEREAVLLPVPYFHAVFTLPARIADIAYQNKAVIYDLLFKASSETMLTIAADAKHLGARLGILSVLQMGLGTDPSPACAHDRPRRRLRPKTCTPPDLCSAANGFYSNPDAST
jgi:hypothetical protein